MAALKIWYDREGLYGLTEVEFAHILNSFPLVPEPFKVAAQNVYRDVERGLIK